ncbi:hypothetical protein [Ruegeria sp. HKCCD8929]|uniref:hypothetical protein n=1 Tax=Ruegeria sp. HKCCD8929 TaxID=2683006 RepID=UPI001489B894|nr:hypothetical protein [Ruegeria sp. HKCCD8929]
MEAQATVPSLSERIATALPATPILALYPRWVEAVAEVKAANNEAARLCAISEAAGQKPGPADKDFEARVIEPAYDRLTAIEDEITDLEARCGEDLAVKVAVTHRVRGVWCDDQIDGLVSDANKLLERA